MQNLWWLPGVLMVFSATICRAAEPVVFVLAGDSTVTDESGWGGGFTEFLTPQGRCINLARSGRSSRSYRSEGWWQRCLEQKPNFLLIQFGHNDQPGKGPQRESAADGAFREHLRQYVREAREIGSQPILVTPLTRRRWTADGRIEPTLQDYATAAQAVAAETNTPLIDLHSASIRQCEQLGPLAFRAFEPMLVTGADHTHLNADGGRVTAVLVVQELLRLKPELAVCFDTQQLAQHQEPRQWQKSLQQKDLSLEADDKTITVRRGSQLVLTWNAVPLPLPSGMDPRLQRSGFLHPVLTPKGAVVTAAYPEDHPHQNGIFMAWTKTRWNDRELNFWDLAAGTGRVLHQRVISTATTDQGISFEVDLIHRAEQEPVVDILRERWRVHVRSAETDCHDFEIQSTQYNQTALPLQVLQYHYGGFAVRGPVDWLSAASDTQIVNSAGADRETANHQHARWVAMTAVQNGQQVTIAMLSHNSNFRAPQAVRVHPSKPYFVYSPAVDGEFHIERGQPYQSRYRFLVCDGPPQPQWIEQIWTAWQAE